MQFETICYYCRPSWSEFILLLQQAIMIWIFFLVFKDFSGLEYFKFSILCSSLISVINAFELRVHPAENLSNCWSCLIISLLWKNSMWGGPTAELISLLSVIPLCQACFYYIALKCPGYFLLGHPRVVSGIRTQV